MNKSQALVLEYPFTDVLVGSAEIADVIPLSDQSLYILGKKTGTTNVSVLNNWKRIIGVVDVEVGPDTGSVAEKLAAGTGAGGIRVRSSGDQVILEGTAIDAPTVDRAVEIARASSPAASLSDPRCLAQQVMLKVRFLEVYRNAGREFGIRSDYLGQTRPRELDMVNQPIRSRASGIDTLLGSTVAFATILAASPTTREY